MIMIIGYIVSSLGWLFVLLMLIRRLRSKIKAVDLAQKEAPLMNIWSPAVSHQ